MGRTELCDWKQALAFPKRVRVALALASAWRVLPVLAEKKKAHSNAKKALTEGWRWIIRERYSLQDVYEKIWDSLFLKLDDPRQKAAMDAVVSSMYCLYRFSGQWPGGTDVEESTDEVLATTLAQAAKASSDPESEKGWQDEIISRLKVSCVDSADALGPVMRPSDFGIPGEDLDEAGELAKGRRQDKLRLRVGQVVEGTVKSLLTDRAVVDLGGADGLVYLYAHEISDPPPEAPASVLKVKQNVTVVVLKASGGGTIPLVSLKQVTTKSENEPKTV